MIAEVWDNVLRKYKTTDIPDGNYIEWTDDMDALCTCPSCGKDYPFGDMYTSRKYFRKCGVFAYFVCKHCYDNEVEE